MATTDYDFISARNSIIRNALVKIGAFSLGQQPDGDTMVHCIERLNEVVKEWQGRETFLWTVEPMTASITSGVNYVQLSTDPAILSVEAAYLRIDGVEHPLDRVSWLEFQDIRDKTLTGRPQLFALDNKSPVKAYVWPTPDAAYTLFYVATQKLKDFDSATSTGDFSAKWNRALTYALIEDLSDTFRVSISEREYYMKKAAILFAEARKAQDDTTDYGFVRGAYE